MGYRLASDSLTISSGLVNFCVGRDQRRDEAHDLAVRAARQQDQLALERLVQQLLGEIRSAA